MGNKRVLYIGAMFFNYHNHIMKELKNLGYEVDYYNDKPSNNSFVKGIIKLKKDLLTALINKHHEKILSETKEKKYDVIFIVNSKVFTVDTLTRLRADNKSARFIYYEWDSLKLYPDVKQLIPLFDKSYSFDSEDCETYEGLTFLPLFYNRDYEIVGKDDSNEIEYDLISLCTAHPNRYKTISKLFPKLEQEGIRIFSYLYLNPLQFLYNRVFVPEFKYAKPSEFQFKPMPENEYISALKRSNTVFDMNHSMQSGLTMRTIETLGAKKKLITTNQNVKKYDFYNENNILILDEADPEEILDFLHKKYEPISKDIYQKYSLRNWLHTILTESEGNYFK